MATLTIRDLPDEVRDKLRVRAAEHGRSMEAEVREVLGDYVERVRTARTAVAWEKVVSDAQAAFAPFRNAGASTSDELIAERHAEAARDGVSDQVEHDATVRQRSRLAQARAMLRKSVPEGTPLVDEFLAERRAMWGDE